MSPKRKATDLPDFDPAKFLNDDEDIAAYLTVVIEENNPSLLAAALGDVVRANRVALGRAWAPVTKLELRRNNESN